VHEIYVLHVMKGNIKEERVIQTIKERAGGEGTEDEQEEQTSFVLDHLFSIIKFSVYEFFFFSRLSWKFCIKSVTDFGSMN
jgi:hypothetical protein